MRELTSHKVNGLNEVLRIEVLDEPVQATFGDRGRTCRILRPPGLTSRTGRDDFSARRRQSRFPNCVMLRRRSGRRTLDR